MMPLCVTECMDMGYGLPSLDMPVWVWWRAFLENVTLMSYTISIAARRESACLLGRLGILGTARRGRKAWKAQIIDPRSIRNHKA